MMPKAFQQFSRAAFCAGLFTTFSAIAAQGGTVSFNYDPAGRLTTAAFDGGQSILHAYAPSGKLIQRQINPGPSPDSDTDGMTDAWEMLHFATLARNGSGDFDGDGQSDVAEFFAGTLPTDPNSSLRVLPTFGVNGSGVTIEWQSVPGKTYRLQFKNSMNDNGWMTVPGDVIADGATASKSDPTASGLPRRFYHVLLVQ